MMPLTKKELYNRLLITRDIDDIFNPLPLLLLLLVLLFLLILALMQMSEATASQGAWACL